MKNMSSLGLRHENGKLLVLDQTRLPAEEVWVECRTPEDMIALIKRLAIRGAPLIGVGAALALAKLAESGASADELVRTARALREARPTAVNLMTAVDRVILSHGPDALARDAVVARAEEFFDEDVGICEEMAEEGAALIRDGDSVLTHCNSGALATAGVGTALGVIHRAHQQGKRIHVYVDETRPLLQGARLTAWELHKAGVPYTLICDNMAAFLMSRRELHRIFVGADRIARNGDTANKVGTYSLAIAAKHHGVPFHVVAPHTTLDRACPTGRDIPIEQRDPDEVRAGKSPASAQVWNPSFDVTPRELITSFVFDRAGRRIFEGA